MFKSFFKNLFSTGWSGQAIIEYMPTLTLIGTFSISILITGGSRLADAYRGITDCIEAAQEGVPCSCPPDADFEGFAPGTTFTADNPISGVTIYSDTYKNSGSRVHPAALYDTSILGEDDDLGTPNYSFSSDFAARLSHHGRTGQGTLTKSQFINDYGLGFFQDAPGFGNGGMAGRPYQNNMALGNVLIIHETNYPVNSVPATVSDPDDNGGGGTLVFIFDNPTIVSNLRWVDVDSHGGAAETVQIRNADDNILYEDSFGDNGNAGENSLVTQNVGVHHAKSMYIFFSGSGALDGVFFCEE